MKPVLLILLLSALTACGKAPVDESPASIARGDICSLDGMTLADYPGPKGQILWADGKRDWFCDTTEIVGALIAPEQKRALKQAWVQDMAKTDWDKPHDAWIDARNAFYVQGSSKHGGMGATLASFARREDAQAFATQYGGKVLAFSEVTPEVLSRKS
jgi:copper chaperone NosL